MPNTDNPHSLRVYESILKHSNEEAAAKIAFRIPLSKSASIEKKFAWAESVCGDLSDEFDDKTIKEIRMDCACGPGTGKINKLKKIYEASDGIEDFVLKVNKLNQGFTLHNEDNIVFLIYPECYCSCVKMVDKPISKVWCYCTLGYTKRMFDCIFDRNVDVELIESVKTGGSKCVIKIK